MRYLFFIALFSVLTHAAPLSLADITQILNRSHPATLAFIEENASNIAKIQSEYAASPINLSLFAAEAKPDDAKSAFEYNVALGKSFALGDTRSQNLKMALLAQKVKEFEFEKEQIRRTHEIAFNYHDACLHAAQNRFLEKSYADFETLFTKKQKAFALGEISKKELLSLQLEKETLLLKLQTQKTDADITRQTLFHALGVEADDNTLFCEDLHPTPSIIDLPQAPFTTSINSYDAQIEGAKIEAAQSEKNLQTVDLSLGYDDEIDVKRYGVGLSMPLLFTSSTGEKRKISALHQQKALKLHKQNMLREKNNVLKTLQATLENNALHISQLQQHVATFERTLLPLVEKSYQLGESSVLEYLLGRQKLLEMRQSLSQTQRAYYKTLFDLYYLAEIKEIK